MTEITEVLPFTEKRGVLYVAPLGSELPDLTVASDPPRSGQDTKFVMTWPASWLKPKPFDPADPDSAFTDPANCSAREEVDTDSIMVDAFSPIHTVMTSRTALWDFGPAVAANLLGFLRTPRGLSAPTRMMLGWESEDCQDRVLAPQAFLDEYGLFHLEAHQPPRPPAPRRTWWQRLLRRPIKVPPMPAPEPIFEVYRVGELRQV